MRASLFAEFERAILGDSRGENRGRYSINLAARILAMVYKKTMKNRGRVYLAKFVVTHLGDSARENEGRLCVAKFFRTLLGESTSENRAPVFPQR
jgi:hypothetical protein